MGTTTRGLLRHLKTVTIYTSHYAERIHYLTPLCMKITLNATLIHRFTSLHFLDDTFNVDFYQARTYIPRLVVEYLVKKRLQNQELTISTFLFEKKIYNIA